jgi:hypothetical protein
MTPNINPSDPPAFVGLGEYVFQELCRDLLAMQEGIATCEIYGTRGYAQRGIDLLASGDDALSTEVGQCKCYREFSVKDIIDASDEFLKHWEFWKDKNIRRFILFVACPLDQPNQQNEVQNQRSRFQLLGVRYEAWSARNLRTYLQPHRAIAERHIHSEETVNNICGRSSESQPRIPTSPGLDLTLSLLSSQVEGLAAEFSEVYAEKVERIRELSREGKTNEAHQQILEMRQGQGWALLQKPLQARILRVTASLVLNAKKDLVEAKKLRDQAAVIDPTGDEATLCALIRYYEEGHESALKEVDEPENTNTFNLKIGFLIELSRTDDAFATIRNPPSGVEPDAETERLHALLLLLQGDLAGAQKEIEKTFEKRPNWQSVRHALAVIEYYSAYSVAALPKKISSWPAPVSWPLVKRDNEAQQRLRSAEKQFAQLAADAENDDEQRSLFYVWRLACLANDVDRQDEAAEFCRTRLAANPTDNHILAWALSRQYDVDLVTIEESLERDLGVQDDGTA